MELWVGERGRRREGARGIECERGGGVTKTHEVFPPGATTIASRYNTLIHTLNRLEKDLRDYTK